MMRALAAAVIAAGLLVPAASAQEDYPPPGDPGKGPKGGQGEAQKLRVCKRGCRFRTIAAALEQADGATPFASAAASTARASRSWASATTA